MKDLATPQKRQRISKDKRKECQRLFEEGTGYKKTAKLVGLNAYTVREYRRRYLLGDISWAERGAESNTKPEI